MTIDEAAQLVASTTGEFPISGFEFDGAYYILMTPLSDYNPGNDTVHCYYPVVDGVVGDPKNVLGLFLESPDPRAMADAAKQSIKLTRVGK